MTTSKSGVRVERDGEDHLRKLIGISPIACILTNPRADDNPVIAVNAAFEALTGYPAADVIGRNCRFMAGPATEPAPSATLRDAVASGRSAVVEITNYRRDGSSFRNAVMIAPFFDEDGELAFFMGSQMDASADGGEDRRGKAAAAIATLSRRQKQVLREMARGLRHAEIAGQLGITEKTVKMHRGALVRKLGYRTSAEAIRTAVEAEL